MTNSFKESPIMAINYEKIISKRSFKTIEKFNEELKAFAQETGEDEATLYENPNTSFTLSDVYYYKGRLCYTYDGRKECEHMVDYDEEEKVYFENDDWKETIKFWRACLRRAKRYWAMDPDKLDAIQDGEVEDNEEEEE